MPALALMTPPVPGGRGRPANFLVTQELPCSKYSARVITRASKADVLSARLTPPCHVYFMGLIFHLSEVPNHVTGEETDSSGFKTRTIVSTGARDRSSILLEYN